MSNPYAAPAAAAGGVREVPPSEVPSPAPLGTIMLEQDKKGPLWQLALAPETAWLVAPDGDRAYAFTHEEFVARCGVFGSATRLVLTIKGVGASTLSLSTNPATTPTLMKWMALRPELHLAGRLRRRLRSSLPIGLFLVVVSLPIFDQRFDPFVLGAGIGWIATGIIGRWRPHPLVLRIQSIVWFLLAASNAVAAYRGSRISIVMAIVMFFFGSLSGAVYGFYRDLAAMSPPKRR